MWGSHVKSACLPSSLSLSPHDGDRAPMTELVRPAAAASRERDGDGGGGSAHGSVRSRRPRPPSSSAGPPYARAWSPPLIPPAPNSRRRPSCSGPPPFPPPTWSHRGRWLLQSSRSQARPPPPPTPPAPSRRRHPSYVGPSPFVPPVRGVVAIRSSRSHRPGRCRRPSSARPRPPAGLTLSRVA